ncbi:hypothetical protein CYMTET_13393 [Cymbomonas tetramitiformis]|uniref:Poly A polymerase head domain-containing protein n=1 Tax=Cymbomonas tetramitiformis TaxID=36881 RepID=A0AAE0LAX6_9CHLO|nr:hypothetical protein CYMTET_13393 [Cymbomonas tetramitiformis]
MVHTRVVLTEEEQELFELLLGTITHFQLGTTMRAAGGWVRDKLLGKYSDDIDIALDNMLGKDFAEKVNEYLKLKGEETHSVGVIQTNPEQSKHLETARIRVRGLWIDLVNLRSETYAADSRIPEMTFGTPDQDAYRRDLTINSLFYNINAATVEDFTEKGLADLQVGTIRTPLAPHDTFLDDPLRVLRAVRFAARFGFELDPELVASAGSEEVRGALRDKISRERVGAEVEGMLKSADPLRAMTQLHRLHLFPVVFPSAKCAELPSGLDYGAPCVGSLKIMTETTAMLPPGFLSCEEYRILLLASLLLPLRKCTIPVKKKQVPLASHIVREALKMRTKDAEGVAALHAAADKLAALAGDLHLAAACSSSSMSSTSVDLTTTLPHAGNGEKGFPTEICIHLGLEIRHLKEIWRCALPLAAILDHSGTAPLVSEELPEVERSTSAEADHTLASARSHTLRRANLCVEYEGAIKAMQLDRAWEMKPLLDGKAIMAELQMKGGGPVLGKVMGALLEWQLAHPGSDKESCLAYLRENREVVLSKDFLRQ